MYLPDGLIKPKAPSVADDEGPGDEASVGTVSVVLCRGNPCHG